MIYLYTIKKVLLISDTHGYLGDEILKHAKEVDEVWHAGDWGELQSFNELLNSHEVKGVYGNIDNHAVKLEFPLELHFEIEGLNVYITHIGGYPGRYKPMVKKRLLELKPDLYICGHSHICKIMKDNKLNLVHFNPGAIGLKGFHKKRTMIKFGIENGKLIDIQVLEYER